MLFLQPCQENTSGHSTLQTFRTFYPSTLPTLGTCSFDLLAFRKADCGCGNSVPVFPVAETGAQIPNTNPNAAMVIGTLEDGGPFSIRIEGGQQHRTGLQIDTTGTNGVLRIMNPRAFENK